MGARGAVGGGRGAVGGRRGAGGLAPARRVPVNSRQFVRLAAAGRAPEEVERLALPDGSDSDGFRGRDDSSAGPAAAVVAALYELVVDDADAGPSDAVRARRCYLARRGFGRFALLLAACLVSSRGTFAQSGYGVSEDFEEPPSVRARVTTRTR